ncbi:MAG TPA: TrkH family potassium uptake protein [Spirochaetales bacterium]|nr:TrkH family potassium uptake protein [Spirochaetales bacterium]HRY54688.1 TrkH family potassium uptake protein [Spirochaetia bacterium]HRZ63330.1 TrkH family potassium uptake protein [Spirochaetia bacterium]
MLDRPRAGDWKIVCAYTGKALIGVGALHALPLATALACAEWASLVDFLAGLGATMAAGCAMALLGKTERKPSWMHGMVTGGISWLAVMVMAAIPYWLSGHYLSYLDAMFDVMSGFTTTGLTLVQDLDHLSVSLNMWRHLLTFVGGQGVIVLALSFLVKDSAGGYKLYVGEGKDERLFPSVFHTAKAIWKISLVYLGVGAAALWLAGLSIGLGPARAFLHGLWIYMAAWSTGGFAPMSQNILYYHSGLYEALTLVFFIVGSFNFALHHAVWSGNRREIYRNIETVSFATTMSLLALLGCRGLQRLGVYPDAVSLFRKGFYHLASAHTTTGYMTLYPRQLALEWGDLALLAMIAAMLVGGSACSTAGGFKGLRVGIIWKAVVQDTRRLLKPSSAVFTQGFHYHGERSLGEQQLRSAALIVIMYVAMFALIAMAGTACGYPFLDAAFEAASVTGNVGLSIGVTSAAMPAPLKLVYILGMWAGRLEFMAVLATIAFVAAALRGKRR